MTEHTEEAIWRRRYELLPGLQRAFATVDAYLDHKRAGATGATPPASPAPAAGGPAPKQSQAAADTWRAEYAASPALRSEFPSVDSYVAYRKAAAAGRVKLHAPDRPGAAGVAGAPTAGTPLTLTADAIAAEYNASAELQSEFPSLAVYSAWRSAQAAGRAKVHRGTVVTA